MAITRLSIDGYGARRAGSFAGRSSSGPHPVGVISRLTLDAYGGRRGSGFSGKTINSAVTGGHWWEPIKTESEARAERDGRKLKPLEKKIVKAISKAKKGIDTAQDGAFEEYLARQEKQGVESFLKRELKIKQLNKEILDIFTREFLLEQERLARQRQEEEIILFIVTEVI